MRKLFILFFIGILVISGVIFFVYNSVTKKNDFNYSSIEENIQLNVQSIRELDEKIYMDISIHNKSEFTLSGNSISINGTSLPTSDIETKKGSIDRIAQNEIIEFEVSAPAKKITNSSYLTFENWKQVNSKNEINNYHLTVTVSLNSIIN